MSITRSIERRRMSRFAVVAFAFLTILSSYRNSFVSANDNVDDAAVAAQDDTAAVEDDRAAAEDDRAAAAGGDDGNDEFHDDIISWDKDFGEVSVMPVSCINYRNGHMIKFDFYDSETSYQCHFNDLGSFVVSIAHYMRAHFNKQALLLGSDFQLPGDAGYLNCILLQETEYASRKLYAKIGCMQRETFTSTKLQLHVYTDAQCSQPYDDGESSKRHATKGYEINGYYFSTRVSFRPPFYTCQDCAVEEVAETFNKKTGNWYDDDYITSHGKKSSENADEKEGDDYFNDDAYFYSNDDVAGSDDARYNAKAGDDTAQGDDFKHDDAKYKFDDYYGSRRALRKKSAVEALPLLTGNSDQLAVFANEFWRDLETIKGRSLYENNYDAGDWNMCNQIHKYGVYCNDECKSLDAFRVDEWSKSDIFLLGIMCLFMAAMMLLVVARRLKASQKARLYGDENYKPGLPPLAMAFMFTLIMGSILTLAKLKFVNETLVFAVVTCILLFIYMLKLTLFESRRPVLLAAPRHDLFDNPLDDRLFD